MDGEGLDGVLSMSYDVLIRLFDPFGWFKDARSNDVYYHKTY